MARPDLATISHYYHNYINQVPENDLREAFKNESPISIAFFESLPVAKQDYRYADGKWTVKEILQHLIDAERVFSYRALSFARKDKTPLPGFDENDYAVNAKMDSRKWADVLEEFRTVRKSSELLFNSFDDDQLNATGISSGNSGSVLGFGYIIVGHAMHHANVIRERYL